MVRDGQAVRVVSMRSLCGIAVLCLSVLFPWRAHAEESYSIAINRVEVLMDDVVKFAGPEGEWDDVVVQVSYTVTAPDGAEYENPSGGELPFEVRLDYQWQFVNPEDYPGVDIADIVEFEWVSDDHYRVRYLAGGNFQVRVTVTAWVYPR